MKARKLKVYCRFNNLFLKGGGVDNNIQISKNKGGIKGGEG
jgi:hypothetical protein